MATAFICEEAGTALVCSSCCLPFSHPKAGTKHAPKYCSDGCRRAGVSASLRIEKPKGTCAVCAQSFTPARLSSTQRAAGHVQRFCSTKCRSSSQRLYASDLERRRMERLRRLERRGANCSACSKLFEGLADEVLCGGCRRKPREIAVRTPVEIECRNCGATFMRVGKRTHCSATCTRQRNRRIQRHRERSAVRAEAEAIDPLDVFRRDGWKCHICGLLTDYRLRGTPNPRAPELDHILPLSKGGRHVWSNVACSCRQCNNSKRAKPLGQLILL